MKLSELSEEEKERLAYDWFCCRLIHVLAEKIYEIKLFEKMKRVQVFNNQLTDIESP